MPIQIYWKFYHQKNENFQIKKFWYFSYFCSKHRSWVLVRTASTRRRGGCNEYPQSMFLSRNKTNIVYPSKLQFDYIKVGFNGLKLYRHVFVMCIKRTLHPWLSKCIEWRFWSDCANTNAQADLNLCWAHISEGTFCHVKAHIYIYLIWFSENHKQQYTCCKRVYYFIRKRYIVKKQRRKVSQIRTIILKRFWRIS